MSIIKKINLGLQGGGAYGAFAWGALDRLLQDERLELEAISAASAGSINAVVLADGFAHGGGHAGARASLAKFWNTLGAGAMFSPMHPSPFDYLAGRGSVETSPGYLLLQLACATLSPMQMNPLNINPLSMLLATLVDFERVRASGLELFLSATNVRTGTGRIFQRDELTVQHVMASACLPQVFAPVMVDGEAWWDGSFVGNPALGPLVDPGLARDILIIQNNPVARRELPLSMNDVNNRVNEIAFNISLVREISALHHMNTVVDEVDPGQVRQQSMRLHLISGAEHLRELSISSKFNTEWRFIQHLHEVGYQAAGRWLEENFQHVGVASTLDPSHFYATVPPDIASL
ncbi:patatin-like phospholipase family protein [Massilia sp. 9096]|uniref:patatin-like phospholipase family protein n=1 Tax=Massilia sp. 9096 TaxID=1500894 RepID=UPI00068A645A|nr:patatin-like phospholipase family protein [Massilia sp. 9096]